MNDALLSCSLAAAVPLWVHQIVREDWSPERMRRESEECATVVASKGDIIMFRSPKRGETAAAFNALARGVAILSFQVGGVVCFGSRYSTVDGVLRTSAP